MMQNTETSTFHSIHFIAYSGTKGADIFTLPSRLSSSYRRKKILYTKKKQVCNEEIIFEEMKERRSTLWIHQTAQAIIKLLINCQSSYDNTAQINKIKKPQKQRI